MWADLGQDGNANDESDDNARRRELICYDRCDAESASSRRTRCWGGSGWRIRIASGAGGCYRGKVRGVVFLLTFIVASAVATHAEGLGGGGPLVTASECVPEAERERINVNAARFARSLRAGGAQEYLQGPTIAPASYSFIPMAGTAWQDWFINNFVDLDTTSGIRDWDCSDFTYNGHHGHDLSLRSFGNQDVGVPVFAALDGVVADAHDGEFDRNTEWSGQPANYVVLFHGGTHYTWYYHLRQGSVAVGIGDSVRAGQQLGQAASSGVSTGPHLHFESRLGGTYYEPFAGSCRAGESRWTQQLAIPRNTWLGDFAVHNTNSFPQGTFIPHDPVRNGVFVRRGASQPVGVWFIIHNQPANSTWRLRYLRPNGTVFLDSGARAYPAHPFYRYASWWIWYGLNLDASGTWQVELYNNAQLMVSAPFVSLNAGSTPVNGAPHPVTASFDPPWPGTNDAVFCRVNGPLLADPDYDLVRFRFD